MMKVDEKVASIKDRLKEAIRAAEKKQAELARDTGLGTGSISHYLSGSYEPKQEAITKLAIALNVSEKWLCGYDVPKERTIIHQDTTSLITMRMEEEAKCHKDEKVASTKERLKEAMMAAGKTQADLVRKTGLDRGSISRYLSGEIEPRADAACKLASALGVSEKWLWGYAVPKEQTLITNDSDNKEIVAEISYAQAIDKLAKLIEDKEFCELFESYSRLNAKNKQIVKRLITDLSV